MGAFWAEYGVTILLAIILGLLLFLAIRHMVRHRRQGGCHGCSECSRPECCGQDESPGKRR